MKKLILIIFFIALGSCKLTNSPKIPTIFKAFLIPVQPVITSISTNAGVEGDTVTITGKHFTNDSVVTFEGNSVAAITARTTESITATVPLNAKSGAIKVTTSFVSALSNESFTVYRYFVFVPVEPNLEVYKLNPNTGALSAVTGSPFAINLVGGGTTRPNPTGKFLYSTTWTPSNNIKSFIINPATGIPTPTSVPVVTAGSRPVYMDFHPNGNFFYTANSDSKDISAFSIDSVSGNLTKIMDVIPTCTGCNALVNLAASPNGKNLYAIGWINGGMSPIISLSIDQTTGKLTEIQNISVPIVDAVDAIIVDPNSKFVYITKPNPSNVLFGYSINSTTGILTSLPGSPFAGTTNNYRAAMHPSGKYLYTVNLTNAQLAKHDIAPNGSLSAPSILSFGANLNLQFVTIDPSGRFGFITNISNPTTFYIFSIDQSNGTPTLISGNPFTTSASPSLISVARIAQ